MTALERMITDIKLDLSINGDSSHPTVIYLAVGCAALLADKGQVTLNSAEMQQCPPFLQELIRLGTYRVVISLIDPALENPPYIVNSGVQELKEEEKHGALPADGKDSFCINTLPVFHTAANSESKQPQIWELMHEYPSVAEPSLGWKSKTEAVNNKWLLHDSCNSYNNSVTVHCIRESINWTTALPILDSQLHSYVNSRIDTILLVHDYSGEDNGWIAAQVDRLQHRDSLSRILYGIDMRQDSGCFPILTATTFHPLIVTINNSLQIYNPFVYQPDKLCDAYERLPVNDQTGYQRWSIEAAIRWWYAKYNELISWYRFMWTNHVVEKKPFAEIVEQNSHRQRQLALYPNSIAFEISVQDETVYMTALEIDLWAAVYDMLRLLGVSEAETLNRIVEWQKVKESAMGSKDCYVWYGQITRFCKDNKFLQRL
jgi:hypothetical protein